MQYASVGFRLPILIKKKAGMYVICCPPLDIWSQGKTESEARKNIKEAIKLFLITCIEKGTLNEVLKECGFKPVRNIKTPKDRRYVNIPISFSMSSHLLCHA